MIFSKKLERRSSKPCEGAFSNAFLSAYAGLIFIWPSVVSFNLTEQYVGAPTNHTFNYRLSFKLCHLAVVRQLASSVFILSASTRLRKDLSRLQVIFRVNNAELFPRSSLHQAQSKSFSRMKSTGLRSDLEDFQLPASHLSDLSGGTEFDSLPECMERLGENVVRLKLGLNEHLEFTDDSLDEVLDKLSRNLMVRRICSQNMCV